jgi:hypothetical protein
MQSSPPDVVPTPILSAEFSLGAVLLLVGLTALGALLWRREARIKERRARALELAFEVEPSLEVGPAKIAGVIETPGKTLPVVELRLEEKLYVNQRGSRWDPADGSLKTRAFTLRTKGHAEVRVELKRRVKLEGSTVIVPTEGREKEHRTLVADVHPGDRVIVEGELSRDLGGDGYRGGDGPWVLRAPGDEDAILTMPSAVAASRALGAPLRAKISLVVGGLGTLLAVLSVSALPALGADARGEVQEIAQRPAPKAKGGKPSTQRVITASFTTSDGISHVCGDITGRFDRDPVVGAPLTIRHLPMSPSVCEVKGPFTLRAFEAAFMLLTAAALGIGLVEWISNRAKPTDRALLRRPRTAREKRRIEAMIARLFND